jgi:glutathionylspermidine synthase
MTMRRVETQPRPNWQATVESQGFAFHTADVGQRYWDESVYYHFTPGEVDQLEAATYALNEMAIAAVDQVITTDRWADFDVPAAYVPWLRQSWDRDELTLVGRFDLAFDGSGPPKLLEYNADTPTSLLEAAVVQWFWLKDVRPRSDQFNSIHERLIEAWGVAKQTVVGGGRVHFVGLEAHPEDIGTVNYLRDTAIQAGLDTTTIDVAQVGWNADARRFVDPSLRPIDFAFKLYPWEWMMDEAFGPHLPVGPTRWWEPPWKVLLSNKAILAVLWELYPDHPNLVLASLTDDLDGDVVRKPRQSREGNNVTITRRGQLWHETAGDYPGPHVWQRYVPIRTFDGFTPVVGSWMINGYAAGIGVREDRSPVTGNLSRFVPHLFG